MKNTIKNIITWAVMIIAVLMMIFTVISVTTVDKTERNIAGYKMFIALSDSMSATDFEAGDLVVSKSINPYEITEGDIISFSSRNEENYGEVVTHKVREVTEDEDGDLAFRTYGTTTDTDDETLVSASYVLGKYQFRVPKLGYFFNFIHTVPGYIVCILTPFMLLIILNGINTVKLFREYRKEQLEELELEREKLEKEREESKKMMEELLKLKASLEEKESKTEL